MPVETGRKGYPHIFLPDNLDEYVPGVVNLYRRLERPPGARPVLIVPPLGNTDVAIEYFTGGKSGLLTLARLKREQGVSVANKTDDPVNEQMKQIGILGSPETICFPFKIALGYLIKSLDEFEQIRSRIDGNFYPLILTHESSGYCRERLYGALLELTLRKSSLNPHKDFDFYAVHESLSGIWSLICDLSHLSGRNRWGIVNRLNETIERLDILGVFEDRIRYAQSMAANYYEVEDVLIETKHQAAATDLTNQELKKEFVHHLEKVGSMEKIRPEPEGVIAITGEILHCEEFMRNSSHALGEELLKRGFYFRREVGLHHYLHRFRLDWKRLAKFFLGQLNPRKRDLRAERAAAGGLHHDSGGHSEDEMEFYSRQRKEDIYDGIIRLGPFNCLPMVTIEPIANRLLHPKQDEIELLGDVLDPGIGTPLLKITIDEQSGRAGLITRIETFLELAARRKRRLVESSGPP